jgi:hypothetical protein
MAYKCLDAHDGSDCNQLGLYINWYCCQIDCNQLGLCINEYIVQSIAISLIVYQWMLMVVSTVGPTVGWTVDSTWLCWAINFIKAFDSSDKRLLWLSAERV